jgi:hypothetical protein
MIHALITCNALLPTWFTWQSNLQTPEQAPDSPKCSDQIYLSATEVLPICDVTLCLKKNAMPGNTTGCRAS